MSWKYLCAYLCIPFTATFLFVLLNSNESTENGNDPDVNSVSGFSMEHPKETHLHLANGAYKVFGGHSKSAFIAANGNRINLRSYSRLILDMSEMKHCSSMLDLDDSMHPNDFPAMLSIDDSRTELFRCSDGELIWSSVK